MNWMGGFLLQTCQCVSKNSKAVHSAIFYHEIGAFFSNMYLNTVQVTIDIIPATRQSSTTYARVTPQGGTNHSMSTTYAPPLR